MVRITPGELQRRLREAQRKQKQAIDKYNQAVRQHNQKVRQATNTYNQQVAAHNARVRANRQRLKNEITRLSRQPTTTRLVTYRTSVHRVTTAYEQLESRAETHYDDRFNALLDLSEREAANNVGVLNSLLGAEGEADHSDGAEHPDLSKELESISEDLVARWRGAIFSLNPQNPDAARHFCTSSREIIASVLELKAPDADVFLALPGCDVTDQGRPTRRAKIRFFLTRKGMQDQALEEFVEQDMQNVVDLFKVFNDGTHGCAGTFTLGHLATIRKRVEDAVFFLARVIA